MPDDATAESTYAVLRLATRAAGVLLLMLAAPRTWRSKEIAEMLGISQRAVQNHLLLLAELRLVGRGADGGYCLSESAWERLLPRAGPGNGGPANRFAQPPPTTAVNQDPGPKTGNQSQSISDVNLGRGAAAGEGAPRRRKRLAARQVQLYQSLRQAGIGEPMRSRLAELPGLTPQAVQAWRQQLQREKKGRYSTGLLIHVLASGEPPPPTRSNGHILACECEECRRLRYADWD